MRWLIAVGIVVAGVVVGSAIGAQVRRVIANPKRSEKLRGLAAPLGSIAFSLVLAAGLIAALGVADRSSLDRFPDAILGFIPRALVCALTILIGQAIATVVAGAVGTSMLKATGKPQHQITRLVKSLALGVFVILGISQLGVNTQIVDTIVTGLVFGTALSVALLTGLGGRQLAGDVAAGRYLRRILRIGDRVTGVDVPSGTVSALHGATVEFEVRQDSGDDVIVVHVPNHKLLDTTLTVTRAR